MSYYNVTRYLSFLDAVEALTPTERATIDDADPLAAYTLHTGSFEWVRTPIASGGLAYEAAWHALVGGGLLTFLHLTPDKQALLATGFPFRQLTLLPPDLFGEPRLYAAVVNDPGRVKFGFLRAGNAVILADFPGRLANAQAVYQPVENLIPFSSLLS
jgi:hypothetical protein